MPESLRKNATRWRQELCALLSSYEQDQDRINKCRNRYKKDDIKAALKEMYGGLCCYCEGSIDMVAFGEIEHRRPKHSFPAYTFEWDNLHWACPRCNRKKGNKWNEQYPILDSVSDTISEHLGYELNGEIRWDISHRGKTTIEHTDLNRQALREARICLAKDTLESILELNNNSDFPDAERVRKDLEQQTSGKFGSLIQWLMTSYLRDPGATDPTP